jgi:hypothetical protein
MGLWLWFDGQWPGGWACWNLTCAVVPGAGVVNINNVECFIYTSIVR